MRIQVTKFVNIDDKHWNEMVVAYRAGNEAPITKYAKWYNIASHQLREKVQDEVTPDAYTRR